MSTTATDLAMESVASATFTVRENKGSREAEATADVLALVKRAVALEARAKAIEAERAEIRAVLSERMEAEGIDKFVSAGAVRVSRSVTRPNRFSRELFEQAHPGLYDEYKVPGAEQVTMRIK